VGRYNKAPGDIDVASSYWPNANNCSVTGTVAGDDNCNGNGNGIIDNLTINSTSGTDEIGPAWKHLQLSGFINNGIPPVPDEPVEFEPGVNAPASKISGAGYMMAGVAFLSRGTNGGAFTSGFGNNVSNFLYLGKKGTNPDINNLTRAALIPEEAFSIDSKVDDGNVDQSDNLVGFDTGNFQATTADSAPNACDNTSTYVVTHKRLTCLVGIRLN